MKKLPPGFEQTVTEILDLAETVEGRLSPKEIRFLALLAAVPTAPGEVLEIGSFRGKSTVVLARAALATRQSPVIAVDPFVYDPLIYPALREAAEGQDNPGWKVFQANLKKTGVSDHVEFHQEFSSDLAQTWPAGRKLRLLWIDGDHSYRGAKTDFDLFLPFLADGAIVALHDVLHRFAGPARVFAEDILLSPHFGAAGVCGSIGWGQYFSTTEQLAGHLPLKCDLYRRVSRMIPYIAFDQPLRGRVRLGYRLARARIPHGEMHPADFLRQVRLK